MAQARLSRRFSSAHSRPSTPAPAPARTAPAPTATRRARWTWTDVLSLFYLPRYDGPYNVGSLTVELPIPPSIPHPAPHPLRLKDPPGAPAFALTNSLATIYYPSNSKTASSPRPTWITNAQIKGYLKFACLSFLQRLIAFPLAILATSLTKLPTLGSAPIASPPSPNKFPLVLFCHGLTGNRTCYSQYCGQLASRGIVVAAIEHRDRSGAHTLINSDNHSFSSTHLTYIDMEDLTDETRPSTYLIARAYQLEIRVFELFALSQLLSDLGTNEEGWKFIKDHNLRVRGSLGYNGDDGMNWNESQWKSFQSSVDWNVNVTVAGHSFGSATVFAALRHTMKPKHWKKCIMLDPWLETLDHWPSSALPLNDSDNLDNPILVINSPGFTNWPHHFEPLYSFLQDRSNQHVTWFLTIGGIIHSSFSDLPILFERIWRLRGQLKLDSQKALDLTLKASLEFLNHGDHTTDHQILVHCQSLNNTSDEVSKLSPGEIAVHVQPKEHHFENN